VAQPIPHQRFKDMAGAPHAPGPSGPQNEEWQSPCDPVSARSVPAPDESFLRFVLVPYPLLRDRSFRIENINRSAT
jgi:hypothetical protein